MRRRTVLVALGTFVSGCTALSPTQDEPTQTDTATPQASPQTQSPSDNANPTVTDPPPPQSFTFEAEEVQWVEQYEKCVIPIIYGDLDPELQRLVDRMIGTRIHPGDTEPARRFFDLVDARGHEQRGECESPSPASDELLQNVYLQKNDTIYGLWVASGDQYWSNAPSRDNVLTDLADPNLPIRIENNHDETHSITLTVTHEWGETAHEESYELDPDDGEDTRREIYNLEETDPDGIRTFTVEGTMGEQTESVTVKTNACYGAILIGINDAGELSMTPDIC